MIQPDARWLHTISGLGLGGSLLGAVDHDAAVAWLGAGVAGVGFVLSAVLSWYHKLREAARLENAADRRAQLEDVRAMARVQIELEQRTCDIEQRANQTLARVAAAEVRSAELAELIEKVRCRFPKPDGRARCCGAASPTRTPESISN